MKRTFVLIGLVVGISFCMLIKTQAQCPNLDFSMGDFTNWQAYSGTWDNSSVNIVPCQPIQGRHTIMSASQLILSDSFYDEHCNIIPKVPSGFTHSARLGNFGTGAEVDALEYAMTVDSSNSLLVVHFALVMQQDTTHNATHQAQFNVIIKDSLGNPMPLSCSNITVTADSNFSVCDSNGILVRNWTILGFSLEQFIGQTIKIYFEMRNGTQGNSFGYAYVTAECMPMKINTMYCYNGAWDARLRAPYGFAWYKWTRSLDSSWVWESKSYMTGFFTPVDGEVYTCQMTSELDTNYTATYSVKIVYIVLNTDFVLDSYDTCNRTATFADLSTVTNCEYYKEILWEIIDSNNVVLVTSTDSLFTYTFSKPNDDNPVEYLVRLSISACACTGTYDGKWRKERNITIYPYPFASYLNYSATICEGSTYTDTNFTNLTQAGNYYDTLQNATGCDSTICLTLNVISKDTLLIFDTISQGDIYNKNGFNEFASGTYIQNLQNRFGCDSIVVLYLTISNVGIVGINNHSPVLRVYPNPTNGKLQITSYGLQENASYSIYSIVGQMVMQGNLQDNVIDVAPLTNGMYYLKIIGKKNTIIKFVKIK